jgi:hypothetical protein
MAINPNTIFSAASNIAGLLLVNNADTVAIFNENLEQIFVDARPVKADVRETSTVMTHPIETGVIIADNKIINPIEINMLMFISQSNYNSMYTQIKQSFIAGDLFSVQTRTGVYRDMIIADMPHTEDTEVYNGVLVVIHFKQVLFVVPASVSEQSQPANFSPKDPANTNTVQAGIKYPATLAPSSTAAVQSIFTGISYKLLRGI